MIERLNEMLDWCGSTVQIFGDFKNCKTDQQPVKVVSKKKQGHINNKLQFQSYAVCALHVGTLEKGRFVAGQVRLWIYQTQVFTDTNKSWGTCKGTEKNVLQQ